MYLRSIARTHVQGEVNAADIEKAVKRRFGIDLTGKAPCTAVQTSALAAIGSEPARTASDQTGAMELSCSYGDFDSPYGSALTFSFAQGYEQYCRGGESVTIRQIEVAGFAACAAEKPDLGGCTVGVDTAEGQALAATTIGSVTAPVGPLCDRAAEFAATAIAALTPG